MIQPASIYYEACEPGWHVPEAPARHAILLLVTEGSLAYRVGDQRISLAKGDVLHVPRGAVRSAHHTAGRPHQMYVAHYDYEGDGEGIALLKADQPTSHRLHQYDYIRQRFSLLAQHWLRKTHHAAVLCHSMLLEVLAIIEEETLAPPIPDKSRRIVSEVQHYIAANYRRPIAMDELARLVDRTPNHVSRLFKEATGQTITDYTQQLRIAAACDLLAHSQMNAGEVSEFLGFCEPSYFNRVFKRITGTLPSLYLKEKAKVWE